MGLPQGPLSGSLALSSQCHLCVSPVQALRNPLLVLTQFCFLEDICPSPAYVKINYQVFCLCFLSRSREQWDKRLSHILCPLLKHKASRHVPFQAPCPHAMAERRSQGNSSFPLSSSRSCYVWPGPGPSPQINKEGSLSSERYATIWLMPKLGVTPPPKVLWRETRAGELGVSTLSRKRVFHLKAK